MPLALNREIALIMNLMFYCIRQSIFSRIFEQSFIRLRLPVYSNGICTCIRPDYMMVMVVSFISFIKIESGENCGCCANGTTHKQNGYARTQRQKKNERIAEQKTHNQKKKKTNCLCNRPKITSNYEWI